MCLLVHIFPASPHPFQPPLRSQHSRVASTRFGKHFTGSCYFGTFWLSYWYGLPTKFCSREQIWTDINFSHGSFSFCMENSQGSRPSLKGRGQGQPGHAGSLKFAWKKSAFNSGCRTPQVVSFSGSSYILRMDVSLAYFPPEHHWVDALCSALQTRRWIKLGPFFKERIGLWTDEQDKWLFQCHGVNTVRVLCPCTLKMHLAQPEDVKVKLRHDESRSW